MRPGRIDRKIQVRGATSAPPTLTPQIPLPNETARLQILQIHTNPIRKTGEIDLEAIVKLSDGFNGADLRNVATCATGCSEPS